VQQVFISHSAQETAALGEQWAKELQPGWVVGFSGDLGTGKTQLIKGIARGLDFHGKVQSPTFALVNEYSGGRIPIFHLDLYRLETREQIIGAGLEEFFYRPKGVALIEWIERWLGENSEFISQTSGAKKFRLVKIEQLGETERRITYEDFGA
jgi:tRNA threonylcarbamoyladenosine biosynthesis protein TsaE